MTVSVVSGSCSSRPDRLSSVQLAIFTTLGGLTRRPGRLDWLDDVESVAIEEERMIAEQIFELWNHGIVIGNGPRFEFAQSSLELCGVKFHLRAPFGSPRRLRYSTSQIAGVFQLKVGQMRSSVIPAA